MTTGQLNLKQIFRSADSFFIKTYQSAIFSPDNKYLYFSVKNKVYQLNITTKEITVAWSGTGKNSFYFYDWSKDGKYLIYIRNHKLVVYDTAEKSKTQIGISQARGGIFINNESAIIYTLTSLYIYNLGFNTSKLLKVFDPMIIYDIITSSKYIFLKTYDYLFILDFTGTELLKMKIFTHVPCGIAISADEKYLAVRSDDYIDGQLENYVINIIHIATMKIIKQLPTTQDNCKLFFIFDNFLLANITEDNRLVYLNLNQTKSVIFKDEWYCRSRVSADGTIVALFYPYLRIYQVELN